MLVTMLRLDLVVQVEGTADALRDQTQPAVLHLRLNQPTDAVTNARLQVMAAVAAATAAIPAVTLVVIPVGMVVLSAMRCHVDGLIPTTLTVASADRARRREMK